MMPSIPRLFFFFFNDTATTEIYTLSLHDALPISFGWIADHTRWMRKPRSHDSLRAALADTAATYRRRSEEHTSELQSLAYLVCRLLLEKKNICLLVQGGNNFSIMRTPTCMLGVAV